MFDASFFVRILQSLVCPMDDLRFDNGGAIWTKLGEKTSGVFSHQLPNQR